MSRVISHRAKRGPKRAASVSFPVERSSSMSRKLLMAIKMVERQPIWKPARMAPACHWPLWMNAEPMETFKLTQVGAFVPGERDAKYRTRVDAQGNYRFSQLPGNQEFRIAPLGGAWRYDGSKEMVSCLAGKSFRVDFAIQGVLAD